MTPGDAPHAPLFNLRGLMIAALAAFCLCWPMLVTNTVYVFVDTISYIRAGREIWAIIADAFMSVLPAADVLVQTEPQTGTNGTPSAQSLTFDGEPRFGRSIAYSAFVYPILALLGPVGLAWAQGTLTLFALFALVTPNMLRARGLMIVGLAFLICATQLPWRVVYLMPDIFAATIVIFGASLIGPFDHLTRGQKIILTLLTAFAVATHYGNIPFAAGFLGLILVWRLLTSRISLASCLAAGVAIAASPLANLGASVAVLDSASAVPLRLPIVLARSIQDGPGAQYLRTNCDTEDWAICDAFGDQLPRSIREFLWSEDGVRAQSPQMVQRIRDEEVALLTQIFLTYPVAQSWSFAGNAVKQFVQVGQAQIRPIADLDTFASGDRTPQPEALALRDRFENVVVYSTLICALLLVALMLSKHVTPAERRVVLAITLGLVCNAIVFGGLSAPVDRYQARVVWLIPACLILLSAAALARQRHTTPNAREAQDVL